MVRFRTAGIRGSDRRRRGRERRERPALMPLAFGAKLKPKEITALVSFLSTAAN
jgi:hypothetical protein